MKTTNKQPIRASQFVQELETYLKQHGQHPDYDSSSFRNKHYKDVFVALLFCQEGLCAYTEELICDISELIAADWQGGIYIGHIIPQDYDADIEHFDSSLKPKQGWLWENLFVVGVAVNRKNKGTKPVYQFFKPDNSSYNPLSYLVYDITTHLFDVNYQIKIDNPALAAQVKEMIKTLGLNYGSIKSKRMRYLEDKYVDIRLGLKTFEEVQTTLYQFFTAFAMSKDDIVPK